MKQSLRMQIAYEIENQIRLKYHLVKPLTEVCDAVSKEEAYEIKALILKQSKRNGRAFIYIDNHNEFLKWSSENNLTPYYLFAVYYLVDIEPKIITVRIAPWELVNSLLYGEKNFQIGFNKICILPEMISSEF